MCSCIKLSTAVINLVVAVLNVGVAVFNVSAAVINVCAAVVDITASLAAEWSLVTYLAVFMWAVITSLAIQTVVQTRNRYNYLWWRCQPKR